MDRENLRRKAIEQTRESLQSPVDRDLFIVKTVQYLDRMEKDFLHGVEDFRDVYSLHFPELVKELTDDRDFIDILEKYGVHRSGLDPFKGMADDSTGAALPEEESLILQQMLEQLVETKETVETLESYVEEQAREEFRNLSGLLGPVLATRLVALAGSLDELAKKPASTVQMLGAEKALFRHLHGRGSSPKHGVLFQHRFVNNLPEHKRGKMARFMANKAVMAARIDNYGDEDKSGSLRQECEQKFHELKD